MQKNSLFSNALLWFGAAVSVAEIETGTLMAGFVSAQDGNSLARTVGAIVAGHVVGGLLFFLCAAVCARQGVNAMASQIRHYGSAGAKFFAGVNILQLVGWTAVMIAQGAAASAALFKNSSQGMFALMCVVIGVMVALWLWCGAGEAVRLNGLAVGLLFVMVIVLSVRLVAQCAGASAAAPAGEFSFWAAFELSAAMPLSWLPLAGDYVRNAEKPMRSAAVSAAVYTFGSTWMYLIGLFAALYLGTANVTAIFAGFGLFGIALAVVVLSTVTTTFLDAWSAGESATTVSGKIRPTCFSLAVTGLGILLAIFGIMDRLMNFLYFIASVFAPMAAVQIFDYFVCGERRNTGTKIVNCIGWLAGFGVYHACLHYACPFGATFPAMLSAAAMPLVYRLFCRK